MEIHYVGSIYDILEGQHKIYEIKGKSIGVYNINGKFHAILNYCPHEGAELCKGHVTGTTMPSEVNRFIYGRTNEIVRCPWHGWEFDIKTGKSLFSEKVRTLSYKIELNEGKIGVVVS